MTSTNNLINHFYSGRPCVPVDGDVAAQEEQSVSCLETHSINLNANSSVGLSENGPENLSPSETTSDPESRLGRNFLTGRSSAPADVIGNENRINELRVMLEKIVTKKEQIWSGIGKKQGIRIASLNVNGRRDEKKKDKWPKLISLTRSKGIAILGLQESHLNEEETEKLNDKFQKFLIINNGFSTSKEGVSFVLNKELVNGMKWKHSVIIEGRASRLEIETEKDRGLNIILVYAPNEGQEKITFWKLLKSKLKEIDDMENVIVMGDFNSVENALDRYPHREDDEKVKKAWKGIRDKFKLIDGWRLHNPLKKEYTYVQKATKSMSRIDRIYMNSNIYVYGYNWDHIETSVSDHNMVMTDILKAKLPFIGKGVWRMYQDDVDSKITMKRITKLLKEANEKIKGIKENKTGESIQKLWAKVKIEIKNITVEERKARMKQMNKEKSNLKRGIEKRLEKLTNDINDVNLKYQEEIIELKTKLMIKTKNSLTQMQLATRARYREKGEKCTKYWFGLNKEKVGDNTILALMDDNNRMIRKTKEMGEIAVKHHKTLQAKPEMNERRKEAIKKLKKIIEGKSVNEEQREKLASSTTREEIEEAIKNTANGTSPGVDGIPYELYKELIKREKKKADKEVDIIGILHNVVLEIEEKGVTILSTENKRENEFTDGLMFLLFKKKDKWKIENYRPITLLNTDYKIYTKTIAKRLAEVAPTIVHEDQAGFIPQRSLYDHTKTTQMVIEYCEIAEQDGCIVALDQEKAYDKIDHEYLWIILKKFGFPRVFINRIKEMYKNTHKAIMINGIITEKFRVERGVHQGDPMSCMLYDLAIEPLAEALRKSELKGIEIKENIERLIVNLFADDTLVYLGKDDNMNTLDQIIGTFCTASTAKFNVDKTEILPVGKKEFREEMIRERKMGENVITIDKRIIKEGESMRTLGSWVGNAKTDTLQWEKIIKSQEKIIESWNKMNLTTKGKELVLKSLVQSKAVFLATVNGMPKNVEEELEKMYHSFLWNGKVKGLMKWEHVVEKRSKGGLGIPDIAARVEAIEIMWLKRWLSPKEKRPKWAYIMDMILNESIAKKPLIDKESRLNWLIQSWHESEAKEIKLSSHIKRMLKVARKYNITPIAAKYDREAKMNQPLWHNIMMKNANYHWNKKSARCLRENHDIKTIKDLVEWNAVMDCTKPCNNMAEKLIELLPEKINPLIETPRKVKEANLDLTPFRLNKNKMRENKKVFNPDITTRKNWENAIRLFTKEKGPKTRRIKETNAEMGPAYRDEPGTDSTTVLLTIVRDNKNKDDEVIIVMIRLKNTNTKEKRSMTFRMNEGDQNLDKARALAIIWIIKETKGSELNIRTDDKKIVDWIGGNLIEAEKENWLNTENEELWKMALRKLRRKGDRVTISKIKDKSKSNKKLKKMKRKLKEQDKKDIKVIRVRIGRGDAFNKNGAELGTMTQKKAYELIIAQRNEHPGGMKTVENIQKIKEAMERINGRISVREIWRGLKKIYSPQTADFLWKMIHGRIKCGPFFRFIPNWQEKEFCSCGASETIAHILLMCKDSGQEEVWKIVKKKWKQETGDKINRVNIGIIMGIGSIKVKRTKYLNETLSTKLMKKLVTLTTWVIWKERNDRIFNEKDMSPERLKTKWFKEMRKEIRIDLWEKRQDKDSKQTKAMWITNGTFAETVKDKNGKIKTQILLK